MFGSEEHYLHHSNHWIVHPLLALCGHIQCLHSYILHCDISASNQEGDNDIPIKRSADHITLLLPPGGQIKALCFQN